MRRLLISLAVCLALFSPSLAWSSPLDLFGYGARGGAMAGVVAPEAQGHEAVYYNPAGLAFQEKTSFAFGVQAAHYFLKVNGEKRDIAAAPATVIAASVPIPFGGFMANRVTIGLGFVIPTTALLNAGIPGPAEERFVIVENRAQTVSIQAAIGIRIFDWLSLGMGALSLAELIGAIDVEPNETGRIGAQVRDELVADFAFYAGIIGKPTDWLSISLAYRDDSEARFQLPITVSLGDGFPIPVPKLNVAGVAQYDPREVALDVTARINSVLVGLGATWKQWSLFENPIRYTAVPEDYPQQPEPGFHDIFVLRTGAEARFDLGDWWLTPRGGFTWEPSPTPTQKGVHNYLDNDRFIFSAGLGTGWTVISLDLAVQWHYMPTQSDRKDGPLIEEQTTLPPEENPGFPRIEYGGHIVYWNAELGFAF